MAITVSSRPSEYSNSSIFVTTTDVAEDSTHINTRIEASLYVDGVVIAKKVKPKGITTFDFTDILNTKCLFTTPAIDDSSGTAIIDGGKTGSNLITGWTNNAHPLDFPIFTTSGADWTQLVTETGAANKCYSNAIAATTGKVYCILFKSTSRDIIFDMAVKTTPANGNIISFSATNKRVYFQSRTTGNIQLEVYTAVADNNYQLAGTWEMYELNTNDWHCPYYVSFTEKYEDAAGATQTGATSTESTLNLFFKSEVATFTDYIITTNQKFLSVDGYNLSTTARSYPLLKTMPSGKRVSSFLLGVISNTLYQLKTRVTPYNAAGSAQADVDSSLQDIYSPIIGVHTNQTLVATYPRADLKLMSAASVVASEVLRFDNDAICYPDLIQLIWKNQTGGFSSFTFLHQIEKSRQVQREYYKDVDKKDKVIPTSITKSNTITAYTLLSITEKQLEYIQDILESTQIYWQRAADDLVSVTIMSENITTKLDNEFTPFQIELTW